MHYFCEKCKYEQSSSTDKLCPRCGGMMTSTGLPPGSTIAGFKIISELGRGANGVVYRALQVSLNREVALKILFHEKTDDDGFVDNFFKEVRAAAKLNHQHIVQAFDAGSTADGIYYFAMELADGDTLDKYITEHGALPVEKALEAALTIAEALNYAWKKHNMFHGDIKPENIIFTRNGEVKLADFGLAKSSGEIGIEDIMATPMYAPPEVIVGNKAKIGIKSDMYSFGVSLYEMLTGAPPFDEANPRQVLDLHLKEKHIPLAEKLIFIYPDLSELLDRLLEKNPDARPTNWQEIITTLRQVGKEPDTTPLPPPKPQVNLKALSLLIPIITVFCVVIGFALWGIFSFSKLTYDAETPSVIKAVPSDNTRANVPPDDKKSTPDATSQVEIAAPEQPSDKVVRLLTRHQEITERFARASTPNMTLSAINQMRQDIKLLLASGRRGELADALSEKQLGRINDMLQQLDQQIKQIRRKKSSSRIAELKQIVSREQQETTKKHQYLRATKFDVETVAGYFKILDSFFRLPVEQRTRAGLLKAMSGVAVEKLLPELREKIVFIESRLPQRTELFESFMNSPEKFKGLPLPWPIDGLSYKTVWVDAEGIKLISKLSEGAYSRRKLDWENVSPDQQKTLLSDWVGNKKLSATSEQLSMLAATIFARAEYPLPPEIAYLLPSEEQRRWRDLKNDVADIASELAAAADLVGYHQANTTNDYQNLANLIKNFRQKYRKTMVGRLAEEQFILPERWLRLFSPQTIGEANLLDLEQSKVSISAAMNAVAAVCRYAGLNQVDAKTRNALKKQQQRFLQAIEPDAQPTLINHEYDFWVNITPGAIWRSKRPQAARELQINPLPYCPALLDIGDWRTLCKIVDIPHSQLWPEKAGVARFQQKYPALLYALGVVAARKKYGRLKEIIAELRNYAQRRNAPDVFLLAANLALLERNHQKTLDLLAGISFNNKPTAIGLATCYCRLRAAFLAPELDETAYHLQVDSALQQLKPLDKQNGYNLAPLILSAQLAVGKDAKITPRMPQNPYPYQGALLLADAGARNILLEYGNITSDQLCQLLQSQTNASAFRSELAWRLFLLQLTAAPLTPSRLLQQTESALQKRQPATTPFYPELTMLKVAGGVLNGDITAEQAPSIIAAFLDHGSVFPGKGGNYAAAMAPDQFIRLAGTNTIAKRELLPLGMLALAIASPTKRPEILRILHNLKAVMIWPERLLLQRYSELMTVME